MQQILHLDLDVEDELSAVEELAQACLRVELSRDAYVYLLRYFLKLSDTAIVDLAQAVRSGAIEAARVIGITRSNGQRVFAVLEDQPDYIVYRIDSLVDFVRPQDLTVSFMPPFVINLHLLLRSGAVLPVTITLFAFLGRAGVAAQSLLL